MKIFNGNTAKGQGLAAYKADFSASIVVFLVALPLCLGIALASGAPLISGIITGIVGGLVVAAVSGSALSVSGPAAGLTVIVLGAIATLGSFAAFGLAVVLAGGMQLLLGMAKAGSISNFFPSSVIEGMLAAIGIILIINQLPNALGEGHNFFKETYDSITSNTLHLTLSGISLLAVGISLLSILILVFWPKIKILNAVPAPLVVVTLGILLAWIFKATPYGLGSDQYVNIPQVSNMAEFKNLFALPDFSQITNPAVWQVAVTIAIVASIETLLSMEAVDKIDPQRRTSNGNRELLAQGTGNMVAGLLGGLPLTSVIVRSSANVNAGGKTRLSAMLHGGWLLLSFILVPGLINMIPLACLAAVLLVTGYKLARLGLFQQMYRKGWDQFIPFIATILAVLFTDLLKGVAFGMVVATINLLRINMRVPFFYKKKQTDADRHIQINLAEEVSFLNKAAIRTLLSNIKDGMHVTINGANAMYIDPDVVEVLENFIQNAPTRNIKAELININHRYAVPKPDVKMKMGTSFNFRKFARSVQEQNA